MIKTSEISLLDDNFWTEYSKAMGMPEELYQEATERQKKCFHNGSLKFEPVGDEYYYTCVDCDMSFNNMVRFNSKDKFNVPYGNRSFSEEDLTILDQFVEALQDRFVYFCSFEFDVLIDRILNNYSESEFKPFLYLDPPYLITSAPYSRYWNEDKERLLYQKLNELSNEGFKWALSNVIEHNEKENDALSWFLSIEEDRTKVIEIDKSYNFSSGRKRDKKDSREILVLNY